MKRAAMSLMDFPNVLGTQNESGSHTMVETAKTGNQN